MFPFCMCIRLATLRCLPRVSLSPSLWKTSTKHDLLGGKKKERLKFPAENSLLKLEAACALPWKAARKQGNNFFFFFTFPPQKLTNFERKLGAFPANLDVVINLISVRKGMAQRREREIKPAESKAGPETFGFSWHDPGVRTCPSSLQGCPSCSFWLKFGCAVSGLCPCLRVTPRHRLLVRTKLRVP